MEEQTRTEQIEMDGELDYEAEAVEIEENLESPIKKGDDSEEDGQCTPERQEKSDSVEEGKDDGEISDDADFEEGELVESSPQAKQSTKQVCKFFVKGVCTWGNQCRFLHINANGKGCYNMFDLAPRMPPFLPPSVMPPPNIIPRMMNFRPRPPHPYHFMPMPPHFPPLMPLPPRLPMPPPIEDEEENNVSTESDWEIALRETKALVQKSKKKRDYSNRSSDYNKENNYKSSRKRNKSFRYEEVYAAYNSSNNNNDANNRWKDEGFPNNYKKRTNQRFSKAYSNRERSNHRDDRGRSGSCTSLSSFSFSDRSSRSVSHSPSRKSVDSKRSSRSRSYSNSRSSCSGSRSRSPTSRSRTLSRSRSPKSRSLSMDSVSSASSHADSRPYKAHRSKIDTKVTFTSSLGEELKKTRIKIKEEPLDDPPSIPVEPPTPKPLPCLHHLLPMDTSEETKFVPKPVKFTFIKKNSKKVLDVSKAISMDDDTKVVESRSGVKRSGSVDETSHRSKHSKSRREELLKQLQAVEDAIARKRGKV